MLRKFGKPTPGAGPAPLSIIGSDVRIVGDIITDGEMQIDGQVEGDIACKTLIIGPTAQISGEIKAGTIRIHGQVTGRLAADHVTIGRSGKVTGDICHGSLEISSGAQVEGHFLRKEATPEPAALPKPAEPEPAPAVIEAAAPKAKPAEKPQPTQAIPMPEPAEAMAAEDPIPATVN